MNKEIPNTGFQTTIVKGLERLNNWLNDRADQMEQMAEEKQRAREIRQEIKGYRLDTRKKHIRRSLDGHIDGDW